MSQINIIVAASQNMVIGKGNDLPWHIPSDLKRFKELTSGHTVVMGRKCWESIPAKFRPLPNRKNVVVTRNTEYVAEGAEVVHDFGQLLLDYVGDGKDDDEVFIIGGAEIYQKAFSCADVVYLTLIHQDIDGDVKLVGFNKNNWVLRKAEKDLEENGYKFSYLTYI